ncbi:MAG: toxin-antitoxin system YwqK family antitoxin [Bacteroidota bacterium]
MNQEIRVITYKAVNGKYFLDKLFGGPEMEFHMQQMLNEGWTIENQNSIGGQSELGKTTAKAILTGGLSLLFGDSRSSHKIVVTYTKPYSEAEAPIEVTHLTWAQKQEHEARLKKIGEELSSFASKFINDIENLEDDDRALWEDGCEDNAIDHMHEDGDLGMTVLPAPEDSPTRTVTERYPSGEVKFEGKVYAEGGEFIKTGVWKSYWMNGKLMFSGAYSTSLKNGPFTYWHKSGVKLKEGAYCNGTKVGGWCFYSETGELKEQGLFKRGKREGKWYEVDDESGAPIEVNYKNGEIIG